MTLYAFNADTVPVSRLHQLQGQGHKVVLVSPSAERPEGFAVYVSGDMEQNLRDAASLYPEQTDRAYVSDNGDMGVARDLEWRYIWGREFT